MRTVLAGVGRVLVALGVVSAPILAQSLLPNLALNLSTGAVESSNAFDAAPGDSPARAPDTPTLAVKPAASTQSGLRFLCGVQAPYGEWDLAAKFIAGMSREGYTLTPDQRAAWDRHQALTNASWANVQAHYLNRIDVWRRRSIDKNWTTELAFYPFSGPDASNVLAFFPDARQYVLVGLEPVGCIPAGLADYTPSYLAALRHSLDTILTINFFRTNDMERDFGADNLRGVLPALLFMIARSGHQVVSVTPMTITADGALVRQGQAKGETSGVEIVFSSGRDVRRLDYFSLNLTDARLARKPGTRKYLANLPEADTLIKSASYLLHRPHFSIVRDAILAKSRLVVEDDSGIPFRFFNQSAWDVRLNGTYTDPINMFRNWRQDDLKLAYDSRADVQPIDFAVGYGHIRQSILLVAARRGK